MKIGLFAAPVCTFVLGACNTLAPGFEDRDQYVINTPRYYDNRVFYVAPFTAGDKSRSWPLHDAFTARETLHDDPDDKARISHGSPLSIILNSVSLPPAKTGGADRGPRDIAVVLDVTTKSTGANKSIVAWYQRGVQPDQALNFQNLLLYFDPRWDARVAPLIRIRVVDVTSERTAEVREALGQVRQFTGSLGPILATSSQSVIAVATRAAELITSRPNMQLLDYSVEFYSSEQLDESFGSDLTPLRRGRVLLVGRPRNSGSEYWRAFEGRYDGETLQVYKGDGLVSSPVVMLTVSTAQAIVPAIVSSRSTYLQRLLSDSQQADVTAVQAAGRSVWDGVRTYTLIEELRRSRDPDSLTRLVEAYQEQSDSAKLSSDDRALLRQTLRDISSCSLATDDEIAAWWEATQSIVKFSDTALTISNESCAT